MEKLLRSLFAFLLMAILLPGTLSPATAAPQPTLTVRGVVVDSDNVPVVGAYIVEKGTENGTMADSNGQFIINVKDGASLEVSCMGYVTQTVAAAANVRVVLSQDNLFLDETVVVGYGTKRVATITGSVAQVNSDKLNTAPVTNTTHTLAGQLPGLVSKQVSGLPGQDNASLNIRGFGSPLVIVDGVEGNIETLDPGQIESISILKDGSGSIYGARAGNGVILVTTKTGSNQKPTVTLNSSLTLQGNTVTTRPADSFQRALYQNDVYMNAGGVESRKPYLDEELELF